MFSLLRSLRNPKVNTLFLTTRSYITKSDVEKYVTDNYYEKYEKYKNINRKMKNKKLNKIPFPFPFPFSKIYNKKL